MGSGAVMQDVEVNYLGYVVNITKTILRLNRSETAEFKFYQLILVNIDEP
jgi:hypothetical protein